MGLPQQPTMRLNSGRRAVLAGGLMVATAGLADWATPRRLMARETPMPSLAALFGERAGDWVGRPVDRNRVVSPDVQAVLASIYDQTLSMFFEHPRLGEVMLAAAYGGDQSDATRAHRPEVCYPAQGFVVRQIHRQELMLGRLDEGWRMPVRRLMATLGSRREPVTYWINVGGHVATTGWEQKRAQLAHGLRGVVPDGLLVRVSSLDRVPERGWWLQARFLDDWWRSLSPPARARVFGTEVA